MEILNHKISLFVVLQKTTKLIDYVCNMISGASHLSSKSASFKQLMTPGYLAPELIGGVNFSMQPTTKSDVYSLAILIYEVFLYTSHSYTCAGRDDHDLDTSIDSLKSGMLYCTNSQPVVDAQLLHSNSSIPATENKMNNNNSIRDHEHSVDMQIVKDVLKITKFK